jgi:hypothetical protein
MSQSSSLRAFAPCGIDTAGLAHWILTGVLRGPTVEVGQKASPAQRVLAGKFRRSHCAFALVRKLRVMRKTDDASRKTRSTNYQLAETIKAGFEFCKS